MKAAEFEEKEYEGPLYNQLERGNAFLWQPRRRLTALAETTDAPPALFAFLGIEAFCFYFNLMWLTIPSALQTRVSEIALAGLALGS